MNWIKEICFCNYCENTRHIRKKMSKPCSGGCGCQVPVYEDCHTCGLSKIHHVNHHGEDFCRAERHLQGKDVQIVKEFDPAKMYVKVVDNPYVLGGGRDASKFRQMLLAVAGLWLEVDPKYLFNNQVSTVAIPNVTENGLRLMHEQIAEIKNDLRIGRKFCRWCHHHSDDYAWICENCGKDNYFESLN